MADDDTLCKQKCVCKVISSLGEMYNEHVSVVVLALVILPSTTLPLISYQTVPSQIWKHKELVSLYIELQLMNLLQILIPLMYNLIPCDLFQFEGMIR